jgi:hypothetical protein
MASGKTPRDYFVAVGFSVRAVSLAFKPSHRHLPTSCVAGSRTGTSVTRPPGRLNGGGPTAKED